MPLKWDGPLSVMKAGNHEQKDFETPLYYEKNSRKANNSITEQENNIKLKAKNISLFRYLSVILLYLVFHSPGMNNLNCLNYLKVSLFCTRKKDSRLQYKKN